MMTSLRAYKVLWDKGPKRVTSFMDDRVIANPCSTRHFLFRSLYAYMSWTDWRFCCCQHIFHRNMSIKIGFQFILSCQDKICFFCQKKEVLYVHILWRKKYIEKMLIWMQIKFNFGNLQFKFSFGIDRYKKDLL